MKRLFVLLVVLLVAGCANTIDATSLYDARTEYVGDASKVANIVGSLNYPGDYEYDHIVIHSDQAPYGLDVNMKEAGEDASETDFRSVAVQTFALINNVDTVEYYQNNEKIATFDRADVDKQLTDDGYSATGKMFNDESKYNDYVKEEEE